MKSGREHKKLKTKITTALLTSLLLIAALQTARAEDASAMVASCPKCAITWVNQSGPEGKITTYRTEKSTDCAACAADAANFFKTGKFIHTCTNCGDHMACKLEQMDAAKSTPSPTGSTTECTIMCPTCQAVWLKTATEPGKLSIYWYARKEICSGCQDKAIEMINTGKISGTCAHCGDALVNRTPYAVASRLAKAQSLPIPKAQALAAAL